MEVKIISQENIKPSSSSSSSHQRIFKLSFLDQFMPSSYAPIILFYNTNHHLNDLPIPSILKLLKESLSKSLDSFYPLAGIIKDDLSIDCNDIGANFIEARVTCGLHEFLHQPDLMFLHKLLPCGFVVNESNIGSHVTNVQANVFDCGGIAIGISISHKIVDGDALSTFIKGWTSAAMGCIVTSHDAINKDRKFEEKLIKKNYELSGSATSEKKVSQDNSNSSYHQCSEPEAICPKFITSSLFPTNDLWLKNSSASMWSSLLRKGNCKTRRFVFDSSGIAKLKAKVTSSGLKCPTRVQSVSAFLWKSIMSASAQLNGFQKPSLLTHIVNLRRRMEPHLSEHSMGNLFWIAAARYTDENEPEFNFLVGKIREAIARIDDVFIKKLTGNECKSALSESLKEITEMASKDGEGSVDCLGFSSWCKFGYYDADFGFGKPVWVSSIGLEGSIFMNLIILVDTRSGDGIEAWVTLDEQEMSILERNQDLLTYASLVPSPLKIGNPRIIT